MFRVSKLPVENRFKTDPGLEIWDLSIYDTRRPSSDIFFWNSESTAFISLSVADSVNKGSLMNYEKISKVSLNA